MPSSLKALGQARPSGASMAPPAGCCSPAGVQRRLPILAWLPDYSVQWLKMDFIAGLSVGLTVIPQALAYAEVAGLPPQYGLYSAFMGCFVYFFLGTSRDVTLGPTAIMSLLVSFYTFHEPAYAVLLAFLSGCIQLAMGFLRLGFLLDFISCPVIKGFTSAATITIGFGQIKNLLGLQDIPRQFFLQVYQTFRKVGETRVGDAVLGLVCMVLLLVLKLMRDHVPPVHPEMPPGVRLSHGLVWTATTARNALVVSFAALVAYSFEVTGYQPFVLTGQTAEGLPPVRTPPFSVTTANGTVSFTEMVQDMGAGLAVVPLMGLLESIAVAKSFASQNNYRVDANQELLAIGLTNVLGSLVSSYPVTGSFGRTAVNAQSGVCTPAGGLVTGALVLLSLDYLTSPFYYIPKSALAAVTIMAVAPLFDASIFRTLWRVKSVRGAGVGPAAGQWSALPCSGGPPGGDTEPSPGSVPATLCGVGVYPRLQHRLHCGAGARGAARGLPQAGRHPRLRRPAGSRSPCAAVRRPEGGPVLLHPGRGRETLEPRTRDPALQHQRRLSPGTQGRPAEGLMGARMGV
ncbi:sodium-independent sulfate anion transporter isoform X2 [Canis lupus familiaris]|uniref:sodium-independent sulfate anion transporter isoform X3 n=1 Tax=Canis lupus dingo TaxID=286419 RepID=UPI000DC6C1F7|nr:sodium-independent sulfate anion transporter isoform X3 [Canis lupus dingo]XP_038402295.1 sodium-independent sulfate anion transporter isoform X2 [Canis lupus familiaris]XP_038479644.1 sodium-independent sulfate anion transporter isoform X2 [Canis lupus familiaris]XP_038531418.1 sodium-independent sulfate anion transporter isoform X2 [Canis lupus familiaris]